jgi:hypothetical protein
MVLRRIGLVPWWWITDETRPLVARLSQMMSGGRNPVG